MSNYLQSIAAKAIDANPNLHDEISDLYELAMNEINDGGGEMNEAELMERDIAELVNKRSKT